MLQEATQLSFEDLFVYADRTVLLFSFSFCRRREKENGGNEEEDDASDDSNDAIESL